MNRAKKSTDGFTRRDLAAGRATLNVDDAKRGRNEAVRVTTRPNSPRKLGRSTARSKAAATTRPNEVGITPRDPDRILGDEKLASVLASLPEVDEDMKPEKSKKSSRSQSKNDRRVRKGKKPLTRGKKIARIIITAVVVAILAFVAFFVWRFIHMSGNIFEGGIVSITRREPLKEDANGRTNVLVFGTSDDETGENTAPDLTDSIMVLSINQTTKDAYMISLPRDLWVDYGRPCNAGFAGKLNEMFGCARGEGPDGRREGAEALKAQAEDITGLSIQYWVHVNWEVLITAVDAVGGVEVTIESNPPGIGILDRNFDWKCPDGPYTCYFVRYEDGEVVHLDGIHALALARARGAAGGYGLAASNFDRERNQQKILSALQSRAMSGGTLASPVAVLNLMNGLGENLATSFHTSEIRTLIDLAREIRNDNIISVPLLDPANGVNLMTTGMMGSQSVVMPRAGIGNYSEIRAHIAQVLNADPAVREGATIDVLNGSDIEGLALDEANRLEAAGFTIGLVDNADQTAPNTVIYQRNPDMPATAAALETRLGAKVQPAPDGLPGTGDFVVIVGAN